jgi:hypothetical protein
VNRVRDIVEAIEGEYRRYKQLGEGVLSQLDAGQLRHRPTSESNSVATIVWHIAGNLESRFTDLLTTDGEKEWRRREVGARVHRAIECPFGAG